MVQCVVVCCSVLQEVRYSNVALGCRMLRNDKSFMLSAPHCITLQHNTAQCHKLPRTSTHFKTLQHISYVSRSFTQPLSLICPLSITLPLVLLFPMRVGLCMCMRVCVCVHVCICVFVQAGSHLMPDGTSMLLSAGKDGVNKIYEVSADLGFVGLQVAC